MDKLVIEGGYSLKGEVKISGAKNAALPIIASTILTGGWHKITNVPDLRDIKTILNLLEVMGATYKREGRTLLINTENLEESVAPYELVKTMRASVLVLGPLIARFGCARVSLPGGCAIGARPIDLHLKGIALMGADISLKEGYIQAKAKKLRGVSIYLDIPSVTATENLMMAATMAEGETIIHNAAREPEVVALSDALRVMGTEISGAGTPQIHIKGPSNLTPLRFRIIPDRIETGTYIVAAAITGGEITIKDGIIDHLEAVREKLVQTGIEIYSPDANIIYVKGSSKIKSVDVVTQPYPGFPTDMQAQFMALMCLSDGSSVITENIFENRFMHVAELRRMGAQIKITGPHAFVTGVKRLSGAPVMATDLRASASLVLAGLRAEGITEISRVYHLDRGYEHMEKKLSLLGAHIRREKE